MPRLTVRHEICEHFDSSRVRKPYALGPQSFARSLVTYMLHRSLFSPHNADSKATGGVQCLSDLHFGLDSMIF